MTRIIIFMISVMLMLASVAEADTSCGFFEKLFSNSCEQKKELEKLKKRVNTMESYQTYQNCVNKVMIIFGEDRLFAEAYCKNR